eukprot:361487-Pyramimonas_sp.AAC.2
MELTKKKDLRWGGWGEATLRALRRARADEGQELNETTASREHIFGRKHRALLVAGRWHGSVFNGGGSREIQAHVNHVAC